MARTRGSLCPSSKAACPTMLIRAHRQWSGKLDPMSDAALADKQGRNARTCQPPTGVRDCLLDVGPGSPRPAAQQDWSGRAADHDYQSTIYNPLGERHSCVKVTPLTFSASLFPISLVCQNTPPHPTVVSLCKANSAPCARYRPRTGFV